MRNSLYSDALDIAMAALESMGALRVLVPPKRHAEAVHRIEGHVCG